MNNCNSATIIPTLDDHMHFNRHMCKAGTVKKKKWFVHMEERRRSRSKFKNYTSVTWRELKNSLWSPYIPRELSISESPRRQILLLHQNQDHKTSKHFFPPMSVTLPNKTSITISRTGLPLFPLGLGIKNRSQISKNRGFDTTRAFQFLTFYISVVLPSELQWAFYSP